jgi:hypothetical protein
MEVLQHINARMKAFKTPIAIPVADVPPPPLELLALNSPTINPQNMFPFSPKRYNSSPLV